MEQKEFFFYIVNAGGQTLERLHQNDNHSEGSLANLIHIIIRSILHIVIN